MRPHRRLRYAGAAQTVCVMCSVYVGWGLIMDHERPFLSWLWCRSHLQRPGIWILFSFVGAPSLICAPPWHTNTPRPIWTCVVLSLCLPLLRFLWQVYEVRVVCHVNWKRQQPNPCTFCRLLTFFLFNSSCRPSLPPLCLFSPLQLLWHLSWLI